MSDTPSDNFYRAFEDRYRGSREVIAGRLRAYLPFLEPLAALYPAAQTLDVGCGRGEWLELAASLGFDARGVDLDDGMLAECRARGLKVETADAIATLRAMPAASLALVSAFHVVEHIPFDAVRTLIMEALRALKPGGLLVLETPNPENLVVGASSFYRDPSHVRPIPPELLAFAAEFGGFARPLVVRLQEAVHLHGGGRVVLQNVLDGASPDYAVVAQKAAAPEQMQAFDAAFGRSYGISMEDMARRYDRQTAALFDEAADTATRAQALATGMEQVQAHLAELNAARHELGHRAGLIEGRLHAAEVRANEAQQKVVELLSSSSWRITEPYRRAGAAYRRLRDALRDGRVIPGIKRRARGSVVGVGRAVLRNPSAKRVARRLLARFPSLQARLREMVYQAPLSAGVNAPLPADMSPRTRRMHAALERALDEHPNDRTS